MRTGSKLFPLIKLTSDGGSSRIKPSAHLLPGMIMASNRFIDIPQTQMERLAFIEFRLLFLGSATRPDLVHRFGISESAASRDFALYRQLAPDNLFYDRSRAVYLPGEDFVPVFDYLPAQVLTALAEGFGDDFVATPGNWLPAELPSRPRAPSLEVLIPLSRALYTGQALRMTYRSLSSGQGEKTIIPLALVDNGLRWHVRGYEPAQARYADFVLTRIVRADNIASCDSQQRLRQQDTAWQQYLDLELVPHPQLKHPDTIALEYGMDQGCLRLSVRAAVAGYLLRRWNVDCTPQHSLRGPEQLLWLRNVDQLPHHHSLSIAPGFTSDDQHRYMDTADAEA